MDLFVEAIFRAEDGDSTLLGNVGFYQQIEKAA
jgi:hypothetical protein